MDIYNYLNSKDVAEHCRNINYKFDSLEKAFIINDCVSISIEEKHRLYRELMSIEKDVEIPKHHLSKEYDNSFFNALDKYVKYEKKCIDMLKEGGDNIVYTYKFRSENDRDYCESRTIYSSFEKARSAMVEEMNDFFEYDSASRCFGEITESQADRY